jgi:hypothetical protein
MSVLVGDRALAIDPGWRYGVGAVVVAVSAIAILERRRRRRS